MLCRREGLLLDAILLSFGIVGGGGDGGCTAVSTGCGGGGGDCRAISGGGGGDGGNGDGGDCSRIVADNDGNDRVV